MPLGTTERRKTMTLTGRVTIITGASQGIGRAYALGFAEQGASVVIADINESQAETVAKEISENGGRAVAVHCDVSDKESVDTMVSRAVREFGTVDRSEEHTSELQSRFDLVCRLLLEKKNK